MKINESQIANAISKFIETELIPSANIFTKFKLLMFIDSVPAFIHNELVKYQKSGMFPDLFDENGNVDSEIFRERLLKALGKTGKLYIEQIQYYFDADDVNKIYSLMK